MDRHLLSKGGSSDPLVTLELGGEKRSSTCKPKCLAPTWQEGFVLPAEDGAGELVVTVWNACHNRLRAAGAVAGLRQLLLDDNALDALPWRALAAACARTLKMLHASRNRIRELPAEAGALLRLESLKLEANALHGDLCDFSALEALAARGRLRRLDLRRNDLLAVEDLEPHAAAVHRATVSGDLPTVARERTTIQRALTVKSRVRRRLGDDASRASDASYQGDFDALPTLAPTRASKPTRLPRMGRKYVG